MTSISKNMYIDKLDNIINKYDNIYHRTIKMRPVDVKSNTFINSSEEIYDKDPNLKSVILLVRISKYKNIFAKDYVPYCCLKKLSLLENVISDFKGEKVVGTFYEKELQKTNQKEFTVENVIKRKVDNLYVK